MKLGFWQPIGYQCGVHNRRNSCGSPPKWVADNVVNEPRRIKVGESTSEFTGRSFRYRVHIDVG